jgi:ABC-2 type transport system permease protein
MLLRNVWLLSKRDYLERVRTRSFVIFTLLIPVLMFGVSVLPSRLATMQSGRARNIVVVAPDAEFGRLLEEQVQVVTKDTGSQYDLRVELSRTEETRKALDRQVAVKQLDGYLWVTPDAIRQRKIQYVSRSSGDFMEMGTLGASLRFAIMKQRLAAHGSSGEELEELVKPLEIETIDVTRGKTSTQAVFFTAFLLMMILYTTVLMYGMSVMRSILEEKTSRVVEVLLSSVSAKEMMAGKILGVGAVGLTQILIWTALGSAVSLPSIMSLGGGGKAAGINISATAGVFFAVFFLLGYLLYSTMCAALGAMVNSEQEAQQMQFPIVLPMVIPLVMMPYLIRQPDAPLSVIISMIPFCSPLVMYLRIVVQQPPAWQIALSIAILLATIYGMLALSARIYRVGILMHGKRPTLPEILKWVRYA